MENLKKTKQKRKKIESKEEDYKKFIISADRLISALKLAIVKLKSDSKKGILMNNEKENEKNTNNYKLEEENEKSKYKEMEIDISTSSPISTQNDSGLSFPSLFNNVDTNYLFSKQIKTNEFNSKNEEESSFFIKNKFEFDEFNRINLNENNGIEGGTRNYFKLLWPSNSTFNFEEDSNIFINNIEEEDYNRNIN